MKKTSYKECKMKYEKNGIINELETSLKWLLISLGLNLIPSHLTKIILLVENPWLKHCMKMVQA